MISKTRCELCGSENAPVSCIRCKEAHYCGRQHQLAAWRIHRKHCSKVLDRTRHLRPSRLREIPSVVDNGPLSFLETERISCSAENEPYEKTSKSDRIDILWPKGITSTTKILSSPSYDIRKVDENAYYDLLATLCFEALNEDKEQKVLEDICRDVVRDLDQYGVCVVDNFLGRERGEKVLGEVKNLHSRGLFQDGQLVSYKTHRDAKTVRSDRITWVDGRSSDCRNIDGLVERVDRVVMMANRMSGNGEMGRCKIDGRTKAMVACYPAGGSRYVKHVDNPNRDGRRVTAIYYLNPGWDARKDGGLLRIFPAGWNDLVADIEPVFDRLLFFWSDRRNPHEVQPAFKPRYAITLWYFDSDERKTATSRNKSFPPIEETLGTSYTKSPLCV